MATAIFYYALIVFYSRCKSYKGILLCNIINMLEEMRAFVSQNRNGNDVERYYANLVLELMAMIGDWKVVFGDMKAEDIFNSIKQAVRC